MTSLVATITAGTTYIDVTNGQPPVTPLDDLQGLEFWISNLTATTFRINISSPALIDHAFSYTEYVAPVSLPSGGSVSAQDVRDRLHLTVSDVGDSVVDAFIVDAAAEISGAVGITFDPASCSDLAASAIKNQAAIYCANYITGGAASAAATASAFTLGDLSMSQNNSSSQSSGLTVNIKFLQEQVALDIEKLKTGATSEVVDQELAFIIGSG